MKIKTLTAAAVLTVAIGYTSFASGHEAAGPGPRCDIEAMRRTIAILCSDSLGGRRAGSGYDLRTARWLASRLQEAGCRPLFEEMIVPFGMKGAKRMDYLAGEQHDTSYNVVATIGSSYPHADKIVLGAHYDHLGLVGRDEGPLKRGDFIRGANDNASGTAAVLEIARRLQPLAERFKRDLVVVLFSGEETGMVGSKGLVRMLQQQRIAVGHMVNLEMLGRMRGDTLMLQGAVLSQVEEVAWRLPNPDSLRIILPSKLLSRYSDHAAFAKKGIPVSFFLTTDEATVHRPSDTPESLNYEGLQKASDYICRYLYELLTADQIPQRR